MLVWWNGIHTSLRNWRPQGLESSNLSRSTNLVSSNGRTPASEAVNLRSSRKVRTNPLSSKGRTSAFEAFYVRSNRTVGTKPSWWNGIHNGFKNRGQKRTGSSPVEGTK